MKLIQKIKTWFSDHYHILFKSAAVNHLRIQELLKNPDGTYQLTVKFNSYSELKDYQKKVRRLTVSLSSAVAMVIVAFIVAPYIMNPNRSKASNFVWTQSAWKPTGNTGATANLSSPSNFDDYASKSNVDVATGKITLPVPVPASTGDNSTVDANVYKNIDLTRSDRIGFYHSDGSGNYSTSGTALALKKTAGATCGNNEECKSASCSTTCKQVDGGTCNVDSDCAAGACYSNKICGAPWMNVGCTATIHYIVGVYSDGIHPSDNYCSNLGGRLPTHAEIICANAKPGVGNLNGYYNLAGFKYVMVGINSGSINTAYDGSMTGASRFCVK